MIALLQFFIISIFLLAGATEYSFSQDIYEEDDTYLQANVIVPNYKDAQKHTLHDVDDIDWVKFYAIAGESYMFLRSGSSEAIYRYIILYGPDDGDNFEAYAENETLYWQCPANGEGIYYVSIFDIQEPGPGPTDYTLQVRTYFGLGLPVYLTGQIKNTCNQPVPDARIKVSGPDTNSGMSLPNGSFVASLKFEGNYTVTVSADNHQTLVQSVHVPGNKTFWMTKLNNNSPVAKNDQVRCPVGKSVSGNVLNNDSDLDGDSLVAVLDSNVKNGSLVFNSTGAFTYTHNGSRTTTDSFTYHVSDGCKISNTVKVTINQTQTPLTFLMLLMQ